MMVWMCDRCHAVVDPNGSRKNQRPEGWETIRLQPSGAVIQARNWLLCPPCLEAFFAAMSLS